MRAPPPPLQQLLFPALNCRRTLADIYVVGVQEGPMNADALQLGVQRALGRDYCKVGGKFSGPIQIVVFVRMPLTWYISCVEVDSIATKMGGMMRTKGGVGVSFLFDGIRVLFINSHLAAHQDKVSRENCISDSPKHADSPACR